MATELFKHIKIYNYTVTLIDNEQFLYAFIYSLSTIELKTLETYIKNNLANNFIGSFKFPAEASIFFDKKPDGSLRLFINYQDLNNLIINNRYLLSLVKKSLDLISWA